MVASCTGLCGLVTSFGATTVMLGSVEFGVVCDIAGPPRPHSNAIAKIATAEGATTLDDILTTRSPKSGAMSLSGSIDIAFCQEEEKHHWKCPMYLANFRV